MCTQKSIPAQDGKARCRPCRNWGEKLGAYFLRWDARNFGFDTRETYNPSEQAYYEDHGRDILRRMDSDPALSAKTLMRTHYSHRWVMENQLLPLLKG